MKRPPAWLFLIVLVYAMLISYLHFVENPLPFPDRGNAIYVCADDKAWLATVELFRHYGIPPRMRRDTSLAKRAFLADHTILNVTDPEALKRMGDPGAGKSLVVSDPKTEAEWTANFLKSAGFTAEVLENLDPDAPPKSLVFVKSNAWHHWVLVFRKNFLNMGPKPDDWK